MNCISNNMEIRKGEVQDYDAALKLVLQFADESLEEYGTYIDPVQIQKTFDAIYKTSFVGVVDEKIVGVLAGQIVEDICSTRPAFEEVVWYVVKEHRGTGMQLFNYVQQWCVDQGIGRMVMSCMHNSKTEMLFRVYKSLGFEPMETRFIKVLNK